MNISLQLQELDDLIVRETKPPAQAVLRNSLHAIREQAEMHVATLENKVKAAENANAETLQLRQENSDLRQANEKLNAKLLAAKRAKPGIQRLQRS